MDLITKIKAVNELYMELDLHVSGFKKTSGLECMPVCAKCCVKRNIEATILEFLPAAYYLFLTNEYETVLNKIENVADTHCVFLNPFPEKDNCLYYKQRGLVCRLFGFSFSINKSEKKQLVTCKEIKSRFGTSIPEEILENAPGISYYQTLLFSIDPDLSIKYMPINDAICRALEIVLMYFQYRKKRA